MSRPIRTQPIPAKIYRHFAVVTIAITLCIAMFADGENRQALEQQFAARHKPQSANPRKIDLGKPGSGLKLKLQNKASAGGWGEDNRFKVDNDYVFTKPLQLPSPQTGRRTALPMPNARAGAVPVLPNRPANGASPPSGGNPGLEDVASGSAAAASRRNSDVIDPAAFDRMLEQSRRRSGAPDEAG